jgi:hypothetical protein
MESSQSSAIWLDTSTNFPLILPAIAARANPAPIAAATSMTTYQADQKYAQIHQVTKQQSQIFLSSKIAKQEDYELSLNS